MGQGGGVTPGAAGEEPAVAAVPVTAAGQAPERPPFARSAALTYGTNVAVATLSLVNVLITSRALGPEGRGHVAFLTTVGYLTAQLATIGVQEAIVNLAGRRPALSSTLAGNSLVLSLLFGGTAAAAVAVLFVTVPAAGGESAAWLKAVVLASVPMLLLQVFLDHIARAHYRFAASNLAWLLEPVVMVAVVAPLAAVGALTVEAAVLSWIGGQALATVVLALTVGRRAGGFGRPERSVAREMVTFGVRAHLGQAMLLGNYRLDAWILGSVAGARELGPYSVAVAWSEALFFLPTALSLVQRPDLVRAGQDEARREASAIFRLTVLLTLPLIVGMVALAPFLVVVVFGEGFGEAVSQLRVLAFAAPGIIALKLFGNALTAQRRPMRETAAIAVSFTTIVALDVALIPGFGGLGAAAASTVAYTAGGIAAAVIFLRTLSGRPSDLLPQRADVATVAEVVRRARRLLRTGRPAVSPAGHGGAGGDQAQAGADE
ncbi:MAG TPA: oligosaccharide flippase family protein [Acidimicrobiales bacterium]